MKFSLQLSRHSVTFHCCMNQPEKLSKHVVPHNSKYCSIDAFCTKSPKTVVVARLVTFPRPCGHSTFHPAVYSLTNEQLVARRPADKYLMPVRSIRTFIELYSPVLYGSAWPRNCRYHLSNIAASSGLEQVVRPITNSSVLQSFVSDGGFRKRFGACSVFDYKKGLQLAVRRGTNSVTDTANWWDFCQPFVTNLYDKVTTVVSHKYTNSFICVQVNTCKRFNARCFDTSMFVSHNIQYTLYSQIRLTVLTT